MDRDISIPVDGSISIRARRLKQICQVFDGGNCRKKADKEERARRMGNYVARIEGNHCIFSDKTVRPGTFDLRSI